MLVSISKPSSLLGFGDSVEENVKFPAILNVLDMLR